MNSEGTRMHHELNAAGREVQQVHHLVLAVAHKPLVVPRHKLAGDDDVGFIPLLIPASDKATVEPHFSAGYWHAPLVPTMWGCFCRAAVTH